MTLTREECYDILRHLQLTLREYDPDAYVKLSQFEKTKEPEKDLINYIKSLIKYSITSSSSKYGRVLGLINEYVNTDYGYRVEGIRLEITEEEANSFGTKDTIIDLSTLPNRDLFIDELSELAEYIQEELGNSSEAGDSGDEGPSY